MKEITIANTNISVKEFKGERVVTLKDVDIVHERPEGTARRNFNTNKHRFIEGEDYFKVCADEIRTHKIMDISSKVHEDITLLTECGYLMLVKSFTDDLSWTVQRELVKSYFRLKEITTPTELQLPYTYIPKTFHGRPVLTATDVSNIFGVNSATLYHHIKTTLTPNRDYNLLQGEELKEYIKENPQSARCRSSLFIIYNTGLSRIIAYYNLDSDKTPKFMIEHKGYVVSASVRDVMAYVRREMKGIEALTYLVESDDSPYNLETYRKNLVNKLKAISWWQSDVSLVKLGIQPITVKNIQEIHKGDYGMEY